MRQFLCFTVASGLLLTSPSSVMAQRADAHLVCLSLHFPVATTTLLGQKHTLELGTAEGADGLNGEVAPTFDSTFPSHFAVFRFTSPVSPEPLTGRLAVDVPEGGDRNFNGFGDFLEVSQGIEATATTGLFVTAADNGRVLATWSRAAGASSGVCQLKLVSNSFGELASFTARFDVIEYAGTLEYTPGPATVSGSLKLSQTGTPANTLSGPVLLTKAPKNRFDEFDLELGQWANAAAQTLTFTNANFLRDTLLRTNYYGYVDFDDGDLSTPSPDYLTWQLSIDDPNDTDNDGLPDLTDDPVAVVNRPVLRLVFVNKRAQIEISGQAGRTYDLEETASLISPWTKVTSVTLTTRAQTLELPIADKPAVFWRARAQ